MTDRSKHATRRSRLLPGLVALALVPALLDAPAGTARPAVATATPIQHLVVIYQENASFDHYFGRYPHARNPKGEPAFTAAPGTPKVAGLTSALLTSNPNSYNPFRFHRSQAYTCDNKHGYTAEQDAFDNGLMDRFPESTGPTKNCALGTKNPMGYFDGNTVTALWNYAQHFALSDHFFGTGFGPSTPGALNLVSGNTHGATTADVSGKIANGTIIGDADPTLDDCSGKTTAELSGQNVGNLLDTAGVTWGWFQGGFKPSSTVNGAAQCTSSHKNIQGTAVPDYVPHHDPFQYYMSTANRHHLPPTSTAAIGTTDQANHQYDLSDFWSAATGGYLPSVSFLKARGSQDGHPGKSDALDEQTYLVQTINKLEALPQWSSMAIVVAWDDSDGWYDHLMGPIVNPSNDPATDTLNGAGTCGSTAPAAGAYLDRCGYGPRLPFLVISPYARQNFVGHGVIDQSSILRFIENNWKLGRIGDQSMDALAKAVTPLFDFTSGTKAPKLFLDPSTGEPK